jgi:hypothetical protein
MLRELLMPRPIVTMDARKFLHTINESAQSRVNFFSRLISELGKKEQGSWALTALGPKSLVFEDKGTGDFFTADITPKMHNRFEVSGIKKVQIVEAKKGEAFRKACSELIDALCEDDTKSADGAFSKIEAFRFRSRAIPESGVVATRDGEVRRVKVTDGIFTEGIRKSIVESFVGAVKDDVVLEKGRVVRAILGDGTEKFDIPINEMTRRRVVARHMKVFAEDAYKSDAFQSKVISWAGLVCEDKIVDAVQDAAKFLREYQEFCLLTLPETRELVSNSLAAKGQFNQRLAEDVGLMVFRTSLKVNRGDIVESWERTAKRAEDMDLLERAKSLTESKDFEKDYQSLLGYLFTEEEGSKTTRHKAYHNSLKIIRSVVGKIEGNEEMLAAMDDLIAKFDRDKMDDATLYEVEDLLASISSELITAIGQLGGAEMPPMGGAPEGLEGEAPEGLEGGAPESAVELPPMGGEGEGEEGGLEGLEGLDLGGGEEEKGEEEKPKEEKPKEEKPKKEKKEKKEESKDEDGDKKDEPKDESKDEDGDKKDEEPIEGMSESQLKEELEGWRANHATFILEDGVDDCMHQLSRYVKRSQAVKNEEVTKGFKAIVGLYEAAAEAALADPYGTGPDLGDPAPKISLAYPYKGGKQPSDKDVQRVKCPSCKWWLGEAADDVQKTITKKVVAHESVDCPKCGTKLVTEDDDITDPDASDYSGDVKMPHSNIGEGKHSDCAKILQEELDTYNGDIDLVIEAMEDDPTKWKKMWSSLTGDRTHKMTACMRAMKGKVENPAAFCNKLAQVAEDKDVTDPSKKDFGNDIKMPHGNDGHKDEKGGLGDRTAKEMKPANIGAGGITEDDTKCRKCPKCGATILGEALTCSKCETGMTKTEDKDITDPSKKQFAGDIKMPHSNIGEGKCPDCGGKLVIDEADDAQVAVCEGDCDVLYEAKCPTCDTKLGKGGYCISCRKKCAAEDQFKWGTRRRRYGFRRSTINQLEAESIESPSEQALSEHIDSVIADIAKEMEGIAEDKDITSPEKGSYSGDTAMPHSNKGHDVQGTPKVGDVLKTGQTAKGSPTLAETGDKPGETKTEATDAEVNAIAAQVKVEDKDITDPSKKDFGNDIKMPHGNDGHKEQGGGLVNPKLQDIKPANISGGGQTVG